MEAENFYSGYFFFKSMSGNDEFVVLKTDMKKGNYCDEKGRSYKIRGNGIVYREDDSRAFVSLKDKEMERIKALMDCTDNNTRFILNMNEGFAYFKDAEGKYIFVRVKRDNDNVISMEHEGVAKIVQPGVKPTNFGSFPKNDQRISAY